MWGRRNQASGFSHFLLDLHETALKHVEFGLYSKFHLHNNYKLLTGHVKMQTI